MNFRTVVRTVQVHFPALLEQRHIAQRTWLRVRRRPFDYDFRCLSGLSFAPDEVMIDIGANRGQSIDAMRLYHPKQPIVAFEPNPNLAARLPSLFKGDPHLVVHNVGLGDTPGEFTLQVPSYNGWDFDGQAALNFGEDLLSYIRSSIIGFDEAKLSFKKFRCEVRRLDGFKLKPGFLKIDTEGSELRVLRGAIETIRTHRPILLIENSSPSAVIDFLKPIGYSEFHFEGRLCAGRGVRNTIYVHHDANRQADNDSD
jgi:FkbM family methyltransferase